MAARNASLCVGVVNYDHPAYGASSGRLRFAASDALAFSNYLRSAFESDDAERDHRLLVDQEATLGEIQRNLSELAGFGQIELFALYLAGHGERGDSNGGWFCLADAAPSSASLSRATLEQLLTGVPARRVLVVVDCCHAEALLGGMRYFTSLGDQQARFFVASARAHQLAWEDAELRRSVLSDVFLRACSTASGIRSSAGTIKLESALFPFLREQIPLLAAAQKQGIVQEPVTGGMARANVDLPVIKGKSFGRALTITQTLRLRLRQVLVRSAIAAILLFAAVEMLAYHVTADATGRVLVRPGLPLTHAWMPVALLKEIDTGLRVSDLSTARGGASAVAQSKLWGVSSHLGAQNVRPWFAQLAPLLKTPKRTRISLLTLGGEEAAALPEDSEPPIEQVLFLSRMQSRPPALLAAKLYPLRSNNAIACTPGKTAVLDFTVLNVPAGPYALDLWWQSLLASGVAASNDATILVQVQNTAYRARAAREVEDAVAEIRPFALSLALLNGSGEVRKVLATWLDTPCRVHAALALSLFGSQEDNVRAESLLVKDVESFDRNRQGDLANAAQATAATALATMARHRPLGERTMNALADLLLREDPELERTTLARTVLLSAAEGQPLPGFLVDRFLARLEAPERPHEFGHLAALALLARNIAFLPSGAVGRLAVWLHANAQRNHAMSDVHTAIGLLLAREATSSGPLLQLLLDHLSPDTYLPAPAIGYRGELVTYASDERAAIALGRLLQAHALPEDVVERLARFAVARKDAAERQVVVNGLARHWYRDMPQATDVQSRLAATSQDAGRRELEVEVACTRIARRSQGSDDYVQNGLISAWGTETEPELRAAFAQVIARSHWPRYADMTMCHNTASP